MAFNMSIKRDDGYVWLSPDQTPFSFIQRFNFSGNSTFLTKVPRERQIVCFVRGSVAIVKYGISGDFRTLNITAPANGIVYVFSNFVPELGKYGMVFYDDKGKPVFSAEAKPLILYSTKSAIDIDVGFECAVLPSVINTRHTRLSGGSDVWLFGIAHSIAFDTHIGTRIYQQWQTESVGDMSFRYKENIEYIKLSDYD